MTEKLEKFKKYREEKEKYINKKLKIMLKNFENKMEEQQ